MLSDPATPATTGATPDARLARAFELLTDPDVRVVSFDVFDTLVFRRVPDPADAFELLGARMLDRGLLPSGTLPAVLSRLRVAAEARARVRRRAAHGGQEVTLDEIYRALAATGILGPEPDFAALADCELEVEGELLTPDADVATLLDAARRRGAICVGVSDTYFSEAQLTRLLSPLMMPLDHLFVSSAYGVGKGGGLWPRVLDALGVEPPAVLHVGDNEDADVRVPRDLGIRTVAFERRDEGLETVLARERGSHVVAEHGDFGLTALRGKLVHRGEANDLDSDLRPFWRYGAVALGPAMTGFAEWVQERTRSYGSSKALCLMREGTLLARMVDAAGGYIEEPVQAEPLWLSRQVLSRAAIRDGRADELAALLVRRSPPTVRSLCATLDIDAARVPALARRADARLDDPALRTEVLGLLSTDPELRTQVIAAAAEARSRVVRLLERVQPPGEPNLVLVDLGWQATTQALLDLVLAHAGVALHTVGLYLLTHAGVIDRQLEGAEVLGFLGESGEPEHEVAAIIRSPEILEQACMPDHGSQVDLTAELEPVLTAPGEESALQAPQRHALQQGMLAFQREWARYQLGAPGTLPRLTRGAAPLLRAQVARAVSAPTGEEARVFSTWLHDENFGSSASESMTAGDVRRALRHLDPKTLAQLPMQLVYWPYGLAALHDEHLARAAELVALGIVPWEAFGSRLETGDAELYVDDGWGFSAGTKLTLRGRRNRFGLSFLHARVEAEDLRALRLDPASGPCLIRLDRLGVRCHRRGGAVVEVSFEDPAELARLDVRGLEWVAPKVLLAGGDDPQIHLDVRALAGGDVYAAELSCALAVLPTLPSQPAGDPLARSALAVRKRMRRAELRTGLPLTPALRRARAALARVRGG